MFPTSVLAHASALSYSGSAPLTSWHNGNQTAIVKLDTPGYPLWVQTYNAAFKRYYFQDKDRDASILLNLTMSHNHKTLLINGQPIVPFPDANVPSKIEALQVPANMYEQGYRTDLNEWLFMLDKNDWSSWRFVELDYDIIVWSDPLAGPWGNNVPRLRFRVMGMGAQGKNERLRLEEQKVLHVELTDMNHGQSDDPKAWFEITEVKLMDEEESYSWPPTSTKELNEHECTTKSWRCPDEESAFYGLNPGGAPYYRWIWRSRFDEYGRRGSWRHDVMQKIGEIRHLSPDFYWKWIFICIIAISSVAMAFLFCAFFWLKWRDYRAERRVDSDWDDGLLGEKSGDEFAEFMSEEENGNDWEDNEKMSTVEPNAKVLVDLEAI